MNREIFLSDLRRALKGIPHQAGEEIIADYQAHFEEAAIQGRTEAETVNALGSPRLLAREHLYDAFYYDWSSRRNLSSLLKWSLMHHGMGFLLPALKGVIALLCAAFLCLLAVLAGIWTGNEKLIAVASVAAACIAIISGCIVCARFLFFRRDALNIPGAYHGQDADTAIERVLAWAPESSMTIDLPAEVFWKPAVTPRAVIRATPWLLEHIRLENNRLGGRFKWRFFHNNLIRVELEGPAIGQWHLNGSGALYLNAVSQPVLNLALTGSGDIRAAGHAETVQIVMRGSGDVDTGLLTQKQTTVEMTGSGDATIAPSKSARLSITGHGDIRLLSHPPVLQINKTGEGDIRLADGSSA